MQKQILGKLGIWSAIWWLVVSEMYIPKTIKMFFFQVTINNVIDVFWRFLFILMPILYVLIFSGSAKAYVKWGGNLNNHLMANCIRNSFIIKIR